MLAPHGILGNRRSLPLSGWIIMTRSEGGVEVTGAMTTRTVSKQETEYLTFEDCYLHSDWMSSSTVS